MLYLFCIYVACIQYFANLSILYSVFCESVNLSICHPQTTLFHRNGPPNTSPLPVQYYYTTTILLYDYFTIRLYYYIIMPLYDTTILLVVCTCHAAGVEFFICCRFGCIRRRIRNFVHCWCSAKVRTEC
jgi:hypothetical protein